MKKIYLILAAAVGMTITSCTTNDYLGEVDPNAQTVNDGAIRFGIATKGMTRAGEEDWVGAAAAAKLGNMFVVEGTKGDEQEDSPSKDVVFDNYLVGYTANTAATTESNTHNWEYVGLQAGIADRMTGGDASTWKALHPDGKAQTQSIKFWDYSTKQYDFIAWSTGTCEAITTTPSTGKVQVTRINTGADLSSTATGKGGFTMTVTRVEDLMQCYYTDINTVLKANYGQPVTLTFRNMATKVRVALYETIPGYSVKDVKFYSAAFGDGGSVIDPKDLGTGSSASNAVLFTTGSDVLPQSGSVLVYYPHIGKTHRDADPKQTNDYNKASVTVTAGSSTTTHAEFGALTANYAGKDPAGFEDAGKYLGRNITEATFAGSSDKNYYTAVFPNSSGKTLTLRVDYTLVSTDGSGETIKVYGAKAVVPATYTEWQPNYAYTYIFKISDNTNGWTSTLATDDAGLYPITFDAVVTSFIDVNAEQTTVTTVATPSITTYQQGHDHANKDEYSKSQKAGISTDVKELYVQVMKTDGSSTPLVADLKTAGKSLLFEITKDDADYVASEAEVMDALLNRTNTPTGDEPAAFKDNNPVGRNGITLTNNTNIANNVESIINGVDDQPITVTSGTAAKIAIGSLDAGSTYAYVYATDVPTSEKRFYNVAAGVTDVSSAANYYEIKVSDIATSPCAASTTAVDGKVYFVKNTDANGESVTYTFKQTTVGEDVEGLYMASIPSSKGTSEYSSANFYFDVYYQNNGSYAVKVFKVVP